MPGDESLNCGPGDNVTMPTVIGARFDDGVVLAGDGREIRDRTVVSEDMDRVVEFDGVAIASPASTNGLDELTRTVDDELRTYENRNGRPVSASAFERILASASQHADADVLGAVRDDEGKTRLIRVDADGGVTIDETAALGTGAAIATGQLETLRTDRSSEEGVEALGEILGVVEDRDMDTGETVDSAVVADD